MLLSNLQNYGYLAVALFIALECIGFPLPGETTLITASVYAGSTHRLNVGVILAVAAAAAIAGDNLGYLVGRRGRGLVHPDRHRRRRTPRDRHVLRLAQAHLDLGAAGPRIRRGRAHRRAVAA